MASAPFPLLQRSDPLGMVQQRRCDEQSICSSLVHPLPTTRVFGRPSVALFVCCCVVWLALQQTLAIDCIGYTGYAGTDFPYSALNATSNCTRIVGSLVISTDDAQLQHLDGLTVITRSLQITNCPNLTNLGGAGGLIALQYVDYLYINSCDSLVSISSLVTLTEVPGSFCSCGVDIRYCPLLTSLDGLGNINSLRSLSLVSLPLVNSLLPLSTIGNSTQVLLNLESLGDTSLDGLEWISDLRGLSIYFFPLPSLGPLVNASSSRLKHLALSGPPWTDLSDLRLITQAVSPGFRLFLSNLYNLNSLFGLSFVNAECFHVYLQAMPQLQSLDDLQGRFKSISNNFVLYDLSVTNLAALQGVDVGGQIQLRALPNLLSLSGPNFTPNPTGLYLVDLPSLSSLNGINITNIIFDSSDDYNNDVQIEGVPLISDLSPLALSANNLIHGSMRITGPESATSPNTNLNSFCSLCGLNASDLSFYGPSSIYNYLDPNSPFQSFSSWVSMCGPCGSGRTDFCYCDNSTWPSRSTTPTASPSPSQSPSPTPSPSSNPSPCPPTPSPSSNPSPCPNSRRVFVRPPFLELPQSLVIDELLLLDENVTLQPGAVVTITQSAIGALISPTDPVVLLNASITLEGIVLVVEPLLQRTNSSQEIVLFEASNGVLGRPAMVRAPDNFTTPACERIDLEQRVSDDGRSLSSLFLYSSDSTAPGCGRGSKSLSAVEIAGIACGAVVCCCVCFVLLPMLLLLVLCPTLLISPQARHIRKSRLRVRRSGVGGWDEDLPTDRESGSNQDY